MDERYKHQIGLPGWGKEGQNLISKSSVVVVGCGGLGSNVAPMLARMGVGEIALMDNDHIEMSNIHRQTFTFKQASERKSKCKVLARICKKINPDCVVLNIEDKLDKSTSHWLADADVIVDGLNNWETRYLINDFAVRNGYPYVYAGVSGVVGMVKAVLPRTDSGDTRWEKAGIVTADLRATLGGLPPKKESRGDKGKSPYFVLPTLLPWITAMQATEVVKILTRNYEAVNKNLVSLNAWDGSVIQMASPSVEVTPVVS